ncbi:hypothetical protein K4T82_06180 [Staphylococcus epidermidis]|uniref:hypothetical protein n=1 Tax=Staphylococcus epidermidis TaxID=1282 RepID=UPI0019325575|nr:hypothetical protein [Staphylococcus epidermidis]MBM0849952.1 hypothetical protein [Staphylococcus epidermidis]MBM6159245.1 hypothetical protein [Staphylococcus epidermidis]MBM6161390.1 hypothetical protein [Staphylococcus epidermidis]MBM6170369.1 hypothetical protein [Staphylococcus epidermidis]MBM6177023.1 hypothetical protein [Staphylococcus epidermidis]
MTKNTLNDLNNHLFAQLERLSDEDLKGEELQEELNRSKAVSDVAKNIVSNGNLILQAHKFKGEQMNADAKLPKMLENKEK